VIDVEGVPLITGGLSTGGGAATEDTVIVNAVSEAVSAPLLTLITMFA
jgi:hypothetical protein